MSAKKKLRRLTRLLEQEQANSRAWRTAAADVAALLRDEREKNGVLEEAVSELVSESEGVVQ